MDPAPADDWVEVIAALGSVDFASALLAALNRAVAIDHVCLMRFVERTRPPVLESASWRGGAHVGRVQQAYLAGLYRHDPVLQLAVGSEVLVYLLDAAAIPDAEHRHVWQQPAGLQQRWSALTLRRGQLLALNLYRLSTSGAFTADDLRWLDGAARLLAGLAEKHVQMVGVQLRSRDRAERIDALDSRLYAICGTLTPRERAVLARALLGMTSQGIALDLCIGVNSVLTYRKRGYARMGVTSQAELFALCW